MTSALLSSNGIKVPEFPNESFQEEWHIRIPDNQTYGWGDNVFALPQSFIGARVKIYTRIGRNIPSGTTDYRYATTTNLKRVLRAVIWNRTANADLLVLVNQGGAGASKPPQQWSAWNDIFLPDNIIYPVTSYGAGRGAGLHFREIRILRY